MHTVVKNNILKIVSILTLAVISSETFAVELNKRIGVDSYHYRYHETVNNSFFVRTKGMLYGADLGISGELNDNWNFAVDGRYARSLKRDMDYKSNSTGTSKGTYSTTELRLLFGKPFGSDPDKEIYYGFGYRFLVDGDDNVMSSTGHFSYRRESTYYYLPIGINQYFDINNDWRAKLNLEYDLFLVGNQYSRIFNGVNNKQNNGFGLRAGLEFINQVGNLNYYFGPFIRYWSIEDSNSVYLGSIPTIIYEPKNKTVEMGFKFGISF